MEKKRKKSEHKMDIYHIKVPTFRRTVELRIWGDKETYMRAFKGTNYEDRYDLTAWIYYLDEEYNCNIIWLRDYNLETLVHELFHCTISILDQVWIDVANWEPPAYIYEEMFTKIWKKCWEKFKLSKDVEKYFD